jgi:chaperone modulatory protein CbpM
MQSEEWVPANEFCTWHRVEFSFIRNLHDSGLIGMTMRDGAAFLPSSELGDLEKFIRWHYDLSINPEGIEAIAHILERVQNLQEENRALRNRLRRYESGAPGTIEPAVEI